MAVSPLLAPFPAGPIVDPATGTMTEVGRAFFQALWARTGNAVGTSSDTTAAGLAHEISRAETAEADLRAADTTLSASIAAETAARVSAVANEAIARQAAIYAAGADEVGARIDGDLRLLAEIYWKL
jgi:hypothetical protein